MIWRGYVWLFKLQLKLSLIAFALALLVGLLSALFGSGR